MGTISVSKGDSAGLACIGADISVWTKGYTWLTASPELHGLEAGQFSKERCAGQAGKGS